VGIPPNGGNAPKGAICVEPICGSFILDRANMRYQADRYACSSHLRFVEIARFAETHHVKRFLPVLFVAEFKSAQDHSL